MKKERVALQLMTCSSLHVKACAMLRLLEEAHDQAWRKGSPLLEDKKTWKASTQERRTQGVELNRLG